MGATLYKVYGTHIKFRWLNFCLKISNYICESLFSLSVVRLRSSIHAIFSRLGLSMLLNTQTNKLEFVVNTERACYCCDSGCAGFCF